MSVTALHLHTLTAGGGSAVLEARFAPSAPGCIDAVAAGVCPCILCDERGQAEAGDRSKHEREDAALHVPSPFRRALK